MASFKYVSTVGNNKFLATFLLEETTPGFENRATREFKSLEDLEALAAEVEKLVVRVEFDLPSIDQAVALSERVARRLA